MFNIKKLFLTLGFSLLPFGAYSVTMHRSIPESWYQSPEDQDNNANPQKVQPLGLADNFEAAAFGNFLQKIYNTNVDALEKIPAPPATGKKDGKNQLPDYAPWHLEMFTTELAVYAKGLVGVLTMKGQPAVQVYWRRQGPKPTEVPSVKTMGGDENTTFSHEFETVQNEVALGKDLEPMIQGALATGKIKNESVFRQQIIQAAQEFQYVGMGLNELPEIRWWLGFFRFDFVVGASGKVLPAPVLATGGDLRLRFDWHRMQKTTPNGGILNFKPSSLPIIGKDLEKFRKELQDFTVNVAKDLESALAQQPATIGLKPSGFRIALGMTASGNIGAIKGNAGAFGHLMFLNSLPVPKVYPAKPKTLAVEDDNNLPPMNVIEVDPSDRHLQFARDNQIMFAKGSEDKSVLFKVDRKAFRKGLLRAVTMGQFFAKKGEEMDSRTWKLFMMRTSFDLSLSGGLDLVTLGGSATAELSFFNTKF